MSQLKKILWASWLMLWSFAAMAAQSTFSSDITSIPLPAIITSMVLAVIGGFAYTLAKISDVNLKLKSVPLEIVKDVFNSMVVGMVIFFGGTYMKWDAMLVAGLITIGGYGGSRTLEPALSTLINWISRLGAQQNASKPDSTQ